jgi:cell division transport system permease protein
MSFAPVWTSSAHRRLLPSGKLHGPTVAVLAIMTFAMIVVGAAGLALSNTAGSVARGVESRFVIQLPAASAAALDRAVAVVRSVNGVAEVKAIPQSEMRQTLEDWLGEAARSPNLPIPALATIKLSPGADPAAVARALRSAVPEASMTAEEAELRPLLRSLRLLQRLALALVLLMAAATAAAVVLAARGALDTHRPTVEIMHGIGATDRQVSRLFERKIAVDAIAGAAAGTFAAMVLFAILGGGIAAAGGELTGTAPLTAGDLLLLALVPILAVLLAVGVAHRTLLGALRSSL